MAWIGVIEPAEASGELKAEYDKAIQRAGRVFNIVKVQGLNAPTLRGRWICPSPPCTAGQGSRTRSARYYAS